ncbi:hypothetical protein [Ideonella sp. A 288]|nr:hypothetical protein [Ideonella sp. A 288]
MTLSPHDPPPASAQPPLRLLERWAPAPPPAPPQVPTATRWLAWLRGQQA